MDQQYQSSSHPEGAFQGPDIGSTVFDSAPPAGPPPTLTYEDHSSTQQPPLPPRPYGAPPQRRSIDETDGIGSQYIRDPHKLIGYLVPFPKPDFHKGLLHAKDGADVPQRFLIYTPPPPPLKAPAEGEKEGKVHKIQRKWQDEVRQAKQSDAKVASWKGVKSRATKGISWAMSKTTNSNLDFINRIPGGSEKDSHADDGHPEGETTKKTVGLEEMILIYPSSLPGSEQEIVSADTIAFLPEETFVRLTNNSARRVHQQHDAHKDQSPTRLVHCHWSPSSRRSC